MSKLTRRSSLIYGAGLLAPMAWAQTAPQAPYPNRPIKLLVPFGPGGGSDAIVRSMTSHMSTVLGQPFVLEFKPGADTQIASSEVSRAAPDGYTLLFGTASGLSYVPLMRKVPPYDPVRDFTPISGATNSILGIFVNPEVPATSLKELVAHARSQPGRLSYGAPSASTILVGEMFLKETSSQMVRIPVKGDAQALTELLGGRLHMTVGPPGPYLQHVATGKLRALAVTARTSKLPGVPTFVEAGFAPMKVKSWNGLFGPAGMPKDIVDQLSRAAQAAMAREDVRTHLEALGFIAAGSSPEEMGALVKDQLDVWRTAIQQAGLVAE